MSLRELYQEMILDHGRAPRNFGSLAEPTHCRHGHNPLCGDKLVVYAIVKDDIVTDLRFEGVGCAISVASASLMTECVKGKSLAHTHLLFNDFHQLVTTGNSQDDQLGKLTIFAGVSEFPARVKCATLAWHTLNAAFSNDDKPVSTE